MRWAAARRGWLEVHADRLICGSWKIPVEQIRAATIYRARYLFLPVRVLEVDTGVETYQFGLNPWARIERHLPFDTISCKVRLGYSPVSLALRIGLLLYVLCVVWRRCG